MLLSNLIEVEVEVQMIAWLHITEKKKRNREEIERMLYDIISKIHLLILYCHFVGVTSGF
jgi:hypothetical protein